jgi:hypothetical protein
MNNSVSSKTRKPAFGSAWEAGVLGAILCASFVSARAAELESAPKPGSSPEQQERLNLMKSKGTEASLTILPVRLGGKPWDRVTEVVGLLLERQGLKNIQLAKTAFEPAAKTDAAMLAVSLAGFVKQHPITTEYALYAELWTDGMMAIVVDKTGALIWSDRLTGQDEPFKNPEPREPMVLCFLLVQRISPQFSLDERTAKGAKPGKMAALMDERSGMPPESERTPLPERLESMKKAMPQATLLVFPPRARTANQPPEPASATDLAKLINEAGFCKAEPAKTPLLLKAPQADPNETKVLWDLARAFRDYARNHPPQAEYVLYADYAFNSQKWQAGYVHFIVCDRKGEWVIVDLQNSHHHDYQSVKPTSREACDRLLVERLKGYLQ